MPEAAINALQSVWPLLVAAVAILLSAGAAIGWWLVHHGTVGQEERLRRERRARIREVLVAFDVSPDRRDACVDALERLMASWD